jgi:hypothetical protein
MNEVDVFKRKPFVFQQEWAYQLPTLMRNTFYLKSRNLNAICLFYLLVGK